MFEIFSADTFAGKFLIAIKTDKTCLPGDARKDAMTILISEWGRGSSLSQMSVSKRRISKDFTDASGAKGWASIARVADIRKAA